MATEGGAELPSFSRSYARVVLFGDSITQFGFSLSEEGWCAAVANHFQRRADIIHRGFSGYNTRWARMILPALVNGTNVPDVVVIFFGANDAAANDHQHIPLDQYKINLKHMCHYLTEVGVAKQSILLLTPPPVSDEDWAKISGVPGERKFSVAKEYARAVCEVGSEEGVGVVDVFGEIGGRKDYRDHFTDGLHLNERGNGMVAELVIKALEERLEVWEKVYPEWNDLNSTNYELLLNPSKL